RPNVRQLADEASIFFAPQLFVDDFDLLINYLPGKPVDRHMHPVMLLAFDNEIILEACCVWFIATRLCYHIDQYVPDPGLGNRSDRSRNNLSSSLHSLVVLRSTRQRQD